MKEYSAIINKLCYQCDAWLVGSAADPNVKEPRDFDILVPFRMWSTAIAIIPDTEKHLNRFNGIKFLDIESDKYVDVWCDDIDKYILRPNVKYLYHPASQTRIEKSNK